MTITNYLVQQDLYEFIKNTDVTFFLCKQGKVNCIGRLIGNNPDEEEIIYYPYENTDAACDDYMEISRLIKKLKK